MATEITVSQTPASETIIEGEVPASQSEVLAAEQTEAITDSAVAIAEIEADARVSIAETQAAVEIAAIESRNEGNEEWRAEIVSLREQVTNLQSTVEILASSIPQPSEVAEAILATTETNISETMPETSSLVPPEENDENPVVVEEPAETRPAKRRHRAI